MQQKITFSEVCSLIASRTGLPRREVDDFLRSLFNVVATSISEGETVRIKGIGSFKATEMSQRKSIDVNTGKVITLPAYTKINFIPAKNLADAVNSPFADFEPVELSDNISDEILESGITDFPPLTDCENTEKCEEPKSSTHDVKYDEDKNNQLDTVFSYDLNQDFANSVSEAPLAPFLSGSSVNDKSDVEKEDTIYIEESSNDVLKTDTEAHLNNPSASYTDDSNLYVPEDATLSSLSNTYSEDYSETHEEYPVTSREIGGNTTKNKNRKYLGFLIGFCSALLLTAVIGITILICCPKTAENLSINSIGIGDPKTKNNVTIEQVRDTPVNTVKEDTIVTNPEHNNNASQAEEIAPTEPSDTKKVYDTVTKTRYLTTIAREHYGNQHFWPYIYEENKTILGHPNRIKPGTKVIVPDLNKYGVNPKNAADIASAKRKEVEIYNRYTPKPKK